MLNRPLRTTIITAIATIGILLIAVNLDHKAVIHAAWSMTFGTACFVAGIVKADPVRAWTDRQLQRLDAMLKILDECPWCPHDADEGYDVEDDL